MQTATAASNYSRVLVVLISVGVLAVLIVLFVVFVLPRIKEKLFVRRVRRSPRETQVRLVYNRIYSAFMKELRLSVRTLSSRDLDSLARNKYGVDLRRLTESYDGVIYGGSLAAVSETGDCDFCEVYSKWKEASSV